MHAESAHVFLREHKITSVNITFILSILWSLPETITTINEHKITYHAIWTICFLPDVCCIAD